jgi:hypothetical protein
MNEAKRDGDQTVELLTRWIESRRPALAATAAALSIPDSVQAVSNEASPLAATITYGIATTRCSPLLDGQLVMRLLEGPTRVIDQAGLELANVLEEEFGDSLVWKWSGNWAARHEAQRSLPPPHNWTDPSPRMSAVLLLCGAVDTYLLHLRALSEPDLDLARKIASEALDFVSSNEMVCVTMLPVGGIELDGEEVAVENLLVRRLTMGEVAELLQADDFFRDRRRVGFHQFGHGPLTERFAIELRSRKPKSDLPVGDGAWRDVVLALQLVGVPLVGRGQCAQFVEPRWMGGVSTPPPLAMPRLTNDEPFRLVPSVLEDAIEILGAVTTISAGQAEAPEAVALRRLLGAGGRVDPADRLVDCVTVLECLLLPDMRSELIYRFTLHGAVYFAQDTAERQRIATELKALYGTRSGLVHGGDKAPSAQIVAEHAEIALDYARRGVLKALRSGWPTRDMLEQLVFGS